VNERKEILGVLCKEGGFLTEASLQEGNPIEPTEEVIDRFIALDRKKDTALRSTLAISSDILIGIARLVSQQNLPIRSLKELKKLDLVLLPPVKNSLSSASNLNLLRRVFLQKRHVPPPKSCPKGYIFNVIPKPTRLFGYSARRPIAVARKAASTTRFHFSTVPIGHLLLWFELVKSHKIVSPILRGELRYKDNDDNKNIANLALGTLFY
jgi:hypothetical protein